MKQMAFMLLIMSMNTSQAAQKTIKATLVFTGIQNNEGSWQLCFANQKNMAYCFNAKRSNTAPYVFYSNGVDGSLKENEKIMKSWFLISYTILQTDRTIEKIIIRVEAITGVK